MPICFRKYVAGAAVDAGVDGRIVGHLHQGSDHPIGLAYPEGEYLKGLVIQVGLKALLKNKKHTERNNTAVCFRVPRKDRTG